MAADQEQRLLWGWETFFEEISAFLCAAQAQYGTANEAFSNYVIERLEICIANVSSLRHHLLNAPAMNGWQPNQGEMRILECYSSLLSEVLTLLRNIATGWQAYIDQLQSQVFAASYQAPTVTSRRPGRPRFDISRDQLQYLLSLSFSSTQIASILGVSRMTIYRRRLEFGMTNHVNRPISDQDLRSAVQEIHSSQPEVGETLIWGRIRAMGFHVSRERVRRAIRTTDPLHTALRWRGNLTTRRPYSVPGPNSLWHIDGHHKLIRWRLVTHCGIDGYSRMVVFIKCSTNNRASTVYELFCRAIRQYGLPSRVRCDQGGENVRVAHHMIHHRGTERRSVIVGSSVHNQRIERFWRDMHRCVTRLFYRLFYYLEYQSLLHPTNEHHLFALHYIYIPRINQALTLFSQGWNSHGIRTEHGMSPNQLFTAGALRLQRSGAIAVDFFHQIDEQYGIDEDEHPTEDEDEGVVIPRSAVQLSEEEMAQLQQTVDPLRDDGNYGIDLYQQVVDIIQNLGQ